MNVALPVAVRRIMYDARAAGLRKLRKRESLFDCPSYWLRPRLFVHGNKWCALKGPTVQTGIAGFGDTPAEAFADFDRRKLTKELRAEWKCVRQTRLALGAPECASPAWFLCPDVYRDGSSCWVLYGDGVQDGIIAFGATLQRAYENFDRYWFSDTRALAYLGWVLVEEDDNESSGVDLSIDSEEEGE